MHLFNARSQAVVIVVWQALCRWALPGAYALPLSPLSLGGDGSGSSSPASQPGFPSPTYSYPSTPSPVPSPPRPRIRLPYPRYDTYNVHTNLRHKIWESSPEQPGQKTSTSASQGRLRTASSSPPRKRLKTSTPSTSPSPSPSTSLSASPSTSSGRLSTVSRNSVAPQAKRKGSTVGSFLKKGIAKMTGGCFKCKVKLR